jgi:hypothetical protein
MVPIDLSLSELACAINKLTQMLNRFQADRSELICFLYDQTKHILPDSRTGGMNKLIQLSD